MTRFIQLLLITTALLVAALLVACGSDDDGDNGDSDGQPVVTEPADGDGGDGDGGDGDGGDGDTGDGTDISGELQDLAARFGDQEFKIEFNFSSATDGVVDDETTMTLYWKPPDGWRLDISDAEGGTSLITRGGTSYSCSEFGGEGQCFESPIASAAPFPFLNIFTDPDALSAQIADTIAGVDVDVDRSTRTIAGQSASCFKYSGTVDGDSGQVEYCFGDNGILLAFGGGGDDGSGGTSTFSMAATSVSSSVAASDLDLPYEILDLGDLSDLIP